MSFFGSIVLSATLCLIGLALIITIAICVISHCCADDEAQEQIEEMFRKQK